MKHLATAFLLAAAAAAHGQTYTDLGTLGAGGFSRAYAVSADGATVVGEYNGAGGTLGFIWTQANGMVNLGNLGTNYTIAYGISGDGNVVVGQSYNGAYTRAFRWTQGGGMVDLGHLGGGYSIAYGASFDGSVIAGHSFNGSANEAFRWTQAGGMVSIGVIAGGSYSLSSGISANGSVIVGESDSGSGFVRAFRWTQAGGMVDLGSFSGGIFSRARGVSADGSTVVGISENGSNYSAFRWTQAGGMVSLGAMPGGNYSEAFAVSADGSVVVGDGNTASGTRAFRWTQAEGMVALGTLGGNFSRAYGVSADGSVVVGMSQLANGDFRAFLYTNRVMLDVQDWLGSVGGVSSMLSTSLDLSRAHLEGAHHRPLAELGRGKSYWATGDIAGSSRSRDLITRSGEAGVTFEPWTNVLAGVGAGYGRQDQQLLNDGSASTYGQYLVGELDFLLADGGILSVLVSSGDWQNETDRGYVTGGGVDYSHGETDIKSTSFRVRYDTPTLTQALGADLKAYVSYGQSRSRADGYDETGGSYAGSFSEMEQTAKEGRLGVAATRKLGEKLRGRLSAEWVRRFDREQAAITATDITSTVDLTLPGAAVVRDQARFGFDLDYLMDAKTTLSFTVHAAGRGEVADVSGAVSLRKAF
jgi:probable HAF family extracellular repeat protein